MGRKLYVGNLPYQTDEEQLQSMFSQVGAVDTVSVVRDKMTGRARGFAFVEMTTDEEAQAAIKQFNGADYGGRAMTVNEAKPMGDRPGGGGGGRGGFGGGGGGRRSEPRW